MKWAPLHGAFEVSENEVMFNGGTSSFTTDSEAVPEFGTILSDSELNTGRVKAIVEFEDGGPATGCELILGYDVESRGFISAGIPDDTLSSFGIHVWHPPGGQAGPEQVQWVPLQTGGDRSFIESNREYMIEAELSGNKIDLSIDGVHLASVTLRSPLTSRARSTGLWCQSFGKVRIKQFEVTANQPRAFVVMQFGSPFNEVYSDVISEVCEEFRLETFNAAEVYGPGLIIYDIIEQIAAAQVIIAEITPTNPNVYFEVGYAFAWNKPVILLARNETTLPFDVSAFRVLFYEDSIGGKNRLVDGLRRHLSSILGARPVGS